MAYVNAASTDVTWPANEVAQTFAFDAGSSANRILIAHIALRNDGFWSIPDDACTYNGVGMTAFGATVTSVQGMQRLFYLVNPASGSNTMSGYVVNTSTGTQVGTLTAIVYDAVDQSTPYDGYTTATGTDTSAELTVTSATGDTPFFLAGWRMSGHTAVTPTNYTERVDNVNSTIIVGAGEGTGAASINFVGTVTGGFAVNGWVAFGCNLNAAAGGGGATVVSGPTLPLLGAGN